MSNTITVYTNLDSLFDTRRGIITHLARENGRKDFTWDMYDPIYQQRTMDFYERKDLGITNEGFIERFSRRTIDDWADENENYFFPSNLLNEMFLLIRKIEFGVNNLLMISEFDLKVNIHPFELSNELAGELLNHIRGAFKFKVNLKLISVPSDKLTATFLQGFDYVFDYWFFSMFNKTYHETYATSLGTGTKFIVPEIRMNRKLPEELENESIGILIEKLSMLQGGKVIYIPTNKSLYDFKP